MIAATWCLAASRFETVQPVAAAVVTLLSGIALVVASRRVERWRAVYALLATGALMLLAQIVAVLIWRSQPRPSLGDTIGPALVTMSVAAATAAVVIAYRPLLIERRTQTAVRRFTVLMVVGVATFVFSDPWLKGSMSPWLIGAVIATGLAMAVLGWLALRELGRSVSLSREVRSLIEAQLWVIVLGLMPVIDARFWAVAGPMFYALIAVDAQPWRRWTGDDPPPRIRPDVRWLGAGVVVAGSTVPVFRVGVPALMAVVLCLLVGAAAILMFVRGLDHHWSISSRTTPKHLRAIAAALPAALNAGRIDLHVQPIVRLADRKLAGFEALLRWNEPGLGQLDAADVAAAARWVGMSDALDRYVIDRIAGRLGELLAKVEVDEGIVSVNVSPQTLQRAGFADWLIEHLGASGHPLDGLVLEIVEDGSVDDWATLRRNVEALQTAGVAIALDDFGDGHSNLRYFTEIDPDLIKLDRSLVQWSESPAGRNLLADVVALVHGRGTRVVVEGVESGDALRRFVELGVEYAQGYVVGRPRPIPDAALASATGVRLRGWIARNLDAVVGETDEAHITPEMLVLSRRNETITVPRDSLVSLRLRRPLLARRSTMLVSYVGADSGRVDSFTFTSNRRLALGRALVEHRWLSPDRPSRR